MSYENLNYGFNRPHARQQAKIMTPGSHATAKHKYQTSVSQHRNAPLAHGIG